jgi:hypothetical protein
MTLLLDVGPRRKIDFQDNIPTRIMTPSTDWQKKVKGNSSHLLGFVMYDVRGDVVQEP